MSIQHSIHHKKYFKVKTNEDYFRYTKTEKKKTITITRNIEEVLMQKKNNTK